MSIGLYDADFMKYNQVPFNLELMKLSSYYKNKGQLVSLTPHLEPNKYTSFFYRKDYADGEFPLIITQGKNVQFDGLAFHPGIYNPMDLNVEGARPDKTIYYKAENLFAVNKTLSHNFSSMMNANHLRLSLDGKTVWNEFESQIDLDEPVKAIFLHDYNLSQIENGYGVLKDFLKSLPYLRVPRRIGSKFPIQCYSGKELTDWTILPTMDYYYPITYKGIIDNEVLMKFLYRKKHTNTLEQFNYDFSYNESFEKFIKEDIISVFLQLCYMRTFYKPMNLIYDEYFFNGNKLWEDLIYLFNLYAAHLPNINTPDSSKIIREESLYSYVAILKKSRWNQRYRRMRIDISRIRELFEFIRKENYELFTLFYDCGHAEYEGGKLIPWKN